MHKFFTSCLLISLSLNLSAQYPEWDNHLLINTVLGGTETSTDVWCLAQSSLLRIDKETKELSIYQNAEIGFNAWEMTDVWTDANDRIYYVTDHLGYYENERWHKYEILQLPQNQRIKNILGQDDTGKFYFLSYAGRLMSWEIGEPVELIPIPQGNATEALMDENGKIWLMHYAWIGSWEDGVFELSLSEESPIPYFNALQLGYEGGELWAKGSQNIYYKKNNTWHFANLQENFGLSNALLVKPIAPQKALVVVDKQVYITTFNNGEWEIENITATFPDGNIPLYHVFVDKSGTIWYIDETNESLWYWQLDQGLTEITNSTWPKVGEVNSLALDPAGRIWFGGGNGLNYLQGGQWELWEPATHNQFNLAVNGLIFTDHLKPLVATGSFLVFGLPLGAIMDWNEETNLWENIDMTGLSFQGQVVTELVQDRNKNIWAMGGFAQNTFCILSNGQWFQYRPMDTSLDSASQFTAFAEAPNGSMWIGTDRGVINYDGFQFTSFDFRDLALSMSQVMDLLVDSKGHLWAAMDHDGVLKWDGEIWEHFTIEKIGVEGRFSAIEEGNNGEIWCALNGKGVLRFDGEKWEHFTHQNAGLHSSYITDIQKDGRGRMWFSGGIGASVYDGSKAGIPAFKLGEEQNIAIFPNPGCCVFLLNWLQESDGKTQIALYNIQGQKIRSLLDKEVEAGEQQLIFNRDHLPSGVYIIAVMQSGTVISEKLVVN